MSARVIPVAIFWGSSRGSAAPRASSLMAAPYLACTRGGAAPIPEWGRRLADRVLADGVTEVPFDQMLVNEYRLDMTSPAHQKLWFTECDKYFFGEGPRIYYFRFFDPQSAVMVGVSVYELNRDPFRLTKHISAERAQSAAK